MVKIRRQAIWAWIWEGSLAGTLVGVMFFPMLTQKILAIVVTIRRAYHRVDVLPYWLANRKLSSQSYRVLVIGFDENDGTVNTVIEY